MNKIIHTIPFLRLTLALAAGIITGPMLQLSIPFLFLLLVLCVISLLWINARYRYVFSMAFGIGVHLFFIFTGHLLWQLNNQVPQFSKGEYYEAVIRENPVEKTKTFQTLLEVKKVIGKDSSILASEKITALFEKSGKVASVQPGQVIVFRRQPELIRNNNNPFEFDYKEYQARKRIYRQVYLSDDSWWVVNKTSGNNLQVKAEQVRALLMKVYARQDWDEREFEVISALTLGYKDGLDDETKSVFAAAGTMHVLAVSGLHVGILFFLLTFIFGFLKKHKYGRIVFILLVIFLLWVFAFITGLSPSVKRAATMFTFVLAGQNLRRQVNIYNTLAASAFFLLFANPNNLFDVGFQLSYTAVFGIVFLQPKLESLVRTDRKSIRYFWRLLTVSVAAQIVTFPLTVYYFHQFPVYFWISNLLVIPAVTAVIPLGIMLLMLNWIPAIASTLSIFITMILKWQFMFLETVEGLPGAVLQLYFSHYEFLIVVIILLALFLLTGTGRILYFRYVLVFMMMYLILSIFIHTKTLFRNEMIVYNLYRHQVVHLIHGKKNYVITEGAMENTATLQSVINKTVLGLRLDQPVYLTAGGYFKNSLLYLNDGIIFFNGHIIALKKIEHTTYFPLNPEIIIDDKNIVSYNDLIVPGGEKNSDPNHCSSRLSEFYSLREKGAYWKKW